MQMLKMASLNRTKILKNVLKVQFWVWETNRTSLIDVIKRMQLEIRRNQLSRKIEVVGCKIQKTMKGQLLFFLFFLSLKFHILASLYVILK